MKRQNSSKFSWAQRSAVFLANPLTAGLILLVSAVTFIPARTMSGLAFTGYVAVATLLLLGLFLGSKLKLFARIKQKLSMEKVERQRVEETIRESESRFRALFQSMNEGVAMH